MSSSERGERSRRRHLKVAGSTIIALALVAAAGSAAAGGQPSAALRTEPPSGGGASHAPAPPPPGGHMAGLPAAAPADVASPEAVLAAYYQSLSGPAGKKRDWNRYLSLFYVDARLLPAEGRGHGGVMPEVFSPQSYLYNTEPSMLKSGYLLKEIARRSEGFGKILHVWSTYGVRHAESDAKPFVRGINSFDLFFDGSRWWIFSLVWQPETSRLTLPQEYLR
ncbi:MAG TPA: hypothetical protein VHQ90_00715 [Thermoanaerobaculia bacterium]|nr:hypothetical protein [Thermoanaerobaculia bacterium]